jgi:hypothetical protein
VVSAGYPLRILLQTADHPLRDPSPLDAADPLHDYFRKGMAIPLIKILDASHWDVIARLCQRSYSEIWRLEKRSSTLSVSHSGTSGTLSHCRSNVAIVDHSEHGIAENHCIFACYINHVLYYR